MSNFIEYLANGAIVSVGSCPAGDVSNQEPCNGGIIKVFDEDTVIDHNLHYVDPITKDLISRPENTAVIDSFTLKPDNKDEITITNLRNPSVVTLSSPAIVTESDTVTDGEYILSVPIASVYKIVIDSFPQQLRIFTVTAYEESSATD